MNFFEKLNVVIIYGGKNDKMKNGPSYFNDMFFLDVETLSWINIEFNDNIYPARAAHCSCLLGNELIIFGGKNEDYFLKSDLLICNLDIIENSKFKRISQVKVKKKKDKENMNSNSEDKISIANQMFIFPLFLIFDIFLILVNLKVK
jgi:N-acetylneuraminic acid mutarotase